MKSLDLKMKELEFNLMGDVKSHVISLNKQQFLNQTLDHLKVCEKFIEFFNKNKIEVDQGKILTISFNEFLHYQVCNLNDEQSISEISSDGEFYVIYGRFGINEGMFLSNDYRLFFGTSRGSITVSLNPVKIERDSFIYKIAS